MYISTSIESVVRWFSERLVSTAVVVAICIVAVWFLFFRSGGSAVKTLTVQRGEFVQSVSVSGTVKAAHDVDLAFEQSGRVGGVYVSVGDTVAAGKTLAVLENADAAALVAAKQAALESAQAKLSSLQAGSRPEDIDIARAQTAKTHQDLVNMYASAPATLADAYAKASDAVRVQLALLFSNAESTSPQLTFLSSASQAVVDTLSGRVLAGRELTHWQSELAALQADTVQDTLDTNLRAARSHLVAIAAFLSAVNAAATDAINAPPGVASIPALKASVSTALEEVNAARSSITSALSNIASQRILVQQFDAQLALATAGSRQQDIGAQAAQVAIAQADLDNARAQAAKTRISAPFSGTITNVDAKVGEIVSPNTPKLSMIGNDAFQIESYIPEVNIALVKVGNQVTVTLDAYGTDTSFGARVVSIDPGETMKDGIATYRAIVQFEKQDPRIRSGMTANVVIITEQQSGVIAVPQGIVVDRDGKHYVSVLVSGKTEEREVATGAISSLGTVEIRSGLAEGDVVVLQAAH